MFRSWLFGFVVLILLGSVQLAGAQTDPYGGSSSNSGASGLPLGNNTDIPPISRRDEGAGLKFKSQATLIEVPVVVTDKSGSHIHQLTKSDFNILEDGKQQRIASFEE